MCTRVRFFLSVAFVGLQLFTPEIFAKPVDACDAFDQAYRQQYIQETSEQIKWKVNFQRLLAGIIVPWGYGAPPWLRGLQNPFTAWDRTGSLLHWRPRATADFDSWFGRGAIFTQAGEVHSVALVFKPSAGDRRMTNQHIATLRRLFPGLLINLTGHSIFDPEGPSVLQFRLLREANESDEEFKAAARSLLNTLFNDPKGELGMRPATPVISKEVLKYATSKDDEAFLRSFGRWTAFEDHVTYAVKRPTEPRSLGTGMSLNTENQSFVFALQTTELRIQTLMNLRRILRASFQSGLVPELGHRLPSTNVHENASVYVTEVPITQISLAFARTLDSFQNSPVFGTPLFDLSTSEKDVVRSWLNDGGLDQTGMSYAVHFEDLVEHD